jgi:hypothetical protein
LGWAPAPAPEPTHAPASDSPLPDSTASHEAVSQPAGFAFNVDDLVCAMNSLGELALDLGEERVITFPPAKAYLLKQFLVNTTVLEQIQSQGQM